MRTPAELFDMTGRPSVVTGAAGHLGRAVAGALAVAGSPVWLVGRNREPLDELAAEIGGQGGDAMVHICDVTSHDQVGALAAAVQDRHGRLDVLVSNAHVARGGTLATAVPDDFREATELAVIATHRLIGATRPLLRAAATDGSPSIVAISSMYGLVSPRPRLYDDATTTNPPFYGAAKAGLLQLARYAAVELAPEGIRVNTVAPGAFPADPSNPVVDRLRSEIPLGRTGAPDDLATAVLYLAAPASRFTTGSTVVVDGGWTAW